MAKPAKRYKSPYKRGSGIRSRMTKAGRVFSWGGLKTTVRKIAPK